MEKNKKLKSFSFRDLRSFKYRQQKQQLKSFKKKRSHYHNTPQLPSPGKFLDPFHFHRIISDFIVVEQLSKIQHHYFSAIHQVIQLKHIVTIDLFEDFAYAKFENSNNYPYSPIDLVLSRLRSVGDRDALKFSEDIYEYKEICLLIKNVKQYGYNKDMLNSYAPKHLKFLKNYFQAMMTTSMTPEQLKGMVDGIFQKNKRNPVFFLVYDEYKEYVGAHLKGVGVNKAMRNLVGWKEFEIYEKPIWCVEGHNYYNYISKIFKQFVINEEFDQELFINSRVGFVRILFHASTHFIVTNNKKMHITICVAKEVNPVQTVPEQTWETIYENENEEKEKICEDLCEKSKMWNKLIDCYFDFNVSNK